MRLLKNSHIAKHLHCTPNVITMTHGSAQSILLPMHSQDAKQGCDFERFLSEQRELLVGFLRRRTACEADAQDAAQESMIRLMRYRERQPTEAWKPLLYRIATNVARDYVRRQYSHCGEAHRSLADGLYELPAEQPSHEQRVSDQQELVIIRNIILHLPTRCRQIYLLNRIEGMSYSEIARHCDISVKAVEKHIAKALVTLRKGLGERALCAFRES